MDKKKVAVIMGSDSDWPVVKGACQTLKKYDVPFEAHILSAHRTAEAASAFAKAARDNGFGAIICAAGMAAHLAGAFAANTTLPVIGIPMKGGALDGLDAHQGRRQLRVQPRLAGDVGAQADGQPVDDDLDDANADEDDMEEYDLDMLADDDE